MVEFQERASPETQVRYIAFYYLTSEVEEQHLHLTLSARTGAKFHLFLDEMTYMPSGRMSRMHCMRNTCYGRDYCG